MSKNRRTDLVEAGAPTVSIPSLPPRLAHLASGLGTLRHESQPIRYNLPVGWEVTPEERKEAQQMLASLTSSLDPMAPFGEHDAMSAKAMLLTKLVRGLGGVADMSDLVATAKIEMFRDAVEDLPAWAIDRAIKMWARSECPEEIEKRPNYSFPPAPGTLRSMALWHTDIPRGDMRRLECLLAALPLERAMDPTPVETTPGLPTLRRM